jgi:hypothetical protein
MHAANLYAVMRYFNGERTMAIRTDKHAFGRAALLRGRERTYGLERALKDFERATGHAVPIISGSLPNTLPKRSPIDRCCATNGSCIPH